jgi:hypothetical protein
VLKLSTYIILAAPHIRVRIPNFTYTVRGRYNAGAHLRDWRYIIIITGNIIVTVRQRTAIRTLLNKLLADMQMFISVY